MKVFITGGSGLLGQYLNMRLSQSREILTVYNNNIGNCGRFNSVKLDIGNTKKLKEVFVSFLPDVVIHTGAYSRPEICDNLSREEVFRINVGATADISVLCEKHKCLLIFSSTDLVYDGNRGSMLKEDAEIFPLSLYAESKFEAEKVIKANLGDFVILRTSLLYGIGLSDSVNNFHKMYDNFKAGKPSRLFCDQFRTPLSLIDAAELIAQILTKDMRGEIINFGGRERVSRVELGEILCDVAGFDKSLIEKISMGDVPGLLKVPDVSLNTDKLRSYGIEQKSIEESIFEILRNING
jgi:dTDP-4-dehydrorhamnose reductase